MDNVLQCKTDDFYENKGLLVLTHNLVEGFSILLNAEMFQKICTASNLNYYFYY